MKWHYSKNGTQLGPIEQHEMIAKIAAGEISASDMCWREGMTDWLPVSKVSEFSTAAAPSATSSEITAPIGGVPNSPYASPMAQNPLDAGVVIPNYLWQSIVVTILCCWPLGIPAIVHAAKVDGLKVRGDIAGAKLASASAKKWVMIAAGVGFLVIAIYIVVMVVIGIGSAAGTR